MTSRALVGRLSMRARMVVLIATAMLPLAGFIAVSIGSDYERTLVNARRDVMEAATLAATRQAQLFATSRTLLDTLRRSPAVTVAGGPECDRLLATIKVAHPQFMTIGVTDAQGVITCHNVVRKRQVFGDLALVKRVMADDAPNFVVGEFGISKVTGKPTFAIAMPLREPFGTKTGMAFVSIDLDRLASGVESVSMGGRRSISIIQPASSRVLSYFPKPSFGSGTVFAGDPVIKAMRDAPLGGVTEGRAFDDVDRIFGFAPIEGAETSGLMLAVGESRSFLMAPVHSLAAWSVAAGLAMMAVALISAWWLANVLQVRPIKRLTDAAARIGAGDFGTRVELASWHAMEMRYLGDTLNRMASHLAAGREAELAVAASEAKYRLLAENTADLITCVDADGRRIFVSPASRDLYGLEPDELTSMRAIDIVHPDDLPIFERMMATLRSGVPVFNVQKRAMHRDGHAVWVEVSGRPTGNGQIVFAIRDISERRRMEEELGKANRQLAALASTDALTGLLNRRAFDQTLDGSFARSVAEGADLSLLMIDVDRFKTFNDRYGHTVGDDCLRQVAEAFRSILRRPGIAIARYGGEEFAVILPQTSLSIALQDAETLRQAVRALAIGNDTSEHGIITISIGAATLTAGGGLSGSLELVRRADAALYEAKARGRDRIEIGFAPIANAS